MKAADARAMTLDQLDDEVLKLKKEQFNLRFQRATGQLENTSRVRVIRRDIARMKTIAAQKRAGMPEPGRLSPAFLGLMGALGPPLFGALMHAFGFTVALLTVALGIALLGRVVVRTIVR